PTKFGRPRRPRRRGRVLSGNRRASGSPLPAAPVESSGPRPGAAPAGVVPAPGTFSRGLKNRGWAWTNEGWPAAMTGTLTPVTPLRTFPPARLIANAPAVLDGPHGSVTRPARQQGLSPQALYRDPQRLVQLLQEPDRPGQRQQLCEQLDTLRGHLAELQALL